MPGKGKTDPDHAILCTYGRPFGVSSGCESGYECLGRELSIFYGVGRGYFSIISVRGGWFVGGAGLYYDVLCLISVSTKNTELCTYGKLFGVDRDYFRAPSHLARR